MLHLNHLKQRHLSIVGYFPVSHSFSTHVIVVSLSVDFAWSQIKLLCVLSLTSTKEKKPMWDYVFNAGNLMQIVCI